MKKIMLLFVLFLIFHAETFAQDSEYETIMKNEIELMFKAETKGALIESINAFERIAMKESEKWHPLYYGAFAQIMLSNKMEDAEDRDMHLNLAEKLVQKAKKIAPNNSELFTLQGFIYMLKIPIDPANRGPQFSGMGTGSFQKAIDLDRENPRAFMLLSDMQFGIAAFMGSKDNRMPCANLEKAIELYSNSEPKAGLDPDWGRDWTEERRKRCN